MSLFRKNVLTPSLHHADHHHEGSNLTNVKYVRRISLRVGRGPMLHALADSSAYPSESTPVSVTTPSLRHNTQLGLLSNIVRPYV